MAEPAVKIAEEPIEKEILLSVNNIEVVYDEVILVLRGISLDVPKGELITLLGPVGVAALTVWPYPRDCGMLLWVYLVGVAAVLAAGIWAMRTAWESRRGLPMVIGLATLLAALVLASAEVLPRVGYAAHELTWTCST